MGFKKVLAIMGFLLSVILLPIYWLTKAGLIGLFGYFSLLVSNVMVIWLALEKNKRDKGTVLLSPPEMTDNDP